jgi:hypothetical protein
MVCQLRPLVYSLGLNNPPRICLTPRKSSVKILWRNKQGNCRCKMAGAGIRSFAKFRGQKCTAECQGLKTVARFVAFRGKFQSGTVQSLAFRGQIVPRSWHSAVYWQWWLAFRSMFESGLPRSYSCCGNPQYIYLAKDWIPAPAILHREPPCLLRHKFLTRDFPIRGELFRPKLYTKGLSWHSISWYYPFN